VIFPATSINRSPYLFAHSVNCHPPMRNSRKPYRLRRQMCAHGLPSIRPVFETMWKVLNIYAVTILIPLIHCR
jgi:hypothetical protein